MNIQLNITNDNQAFALIGYIPLDFLFKDDRIKLLIESVSMIDLMTVKDETGEVLVYIAVPETALDDLAVAELSKLPAFQNIENVVDESQFAVTPARRPWQEITKATEELRAILSMRQDILNGTVKVVEKAENEYEISREHWARCVQAAAEIEKKYGEDVFVDDAFDWGMINGKLSALRWVMGDE